MEKPYKDQSTLEKIATLERVAKEIFDHNVIGSLSPNEMILDAPIAGGVRKRVLEIMGEGDADILEFAIQSLIDFSYPRLEALLKLCERFPEYSVDFWRVARTGVAVHYEGDKSEGWKVIALAFPWMDSPQGHDFWRGVAYGDESE